ncbi:glycerol-3-phosphate dehydrogenase/oxidase [Haliea sp. E17]|uniref:glycerol-3-phosphate dehydrogenase/oxidase n=1 Tax=Haliea sp. E17 TaxID=3401576 RepID=UPI003AAE26F9
MPGKLRATNISKLTEQVYDVLIVGGGINGAVAAAALAGRGVKVALIDREDFASGVSSNSSNLAWGGIKYLESHEYLLVNKLCKSRNKLMRAYPSTVKEIRFFTTIQKGFRFWSFFVYLGALLYWIMGRFATAAPRYNTAGDIKRREPIVNTSNAAGGLEYSDCYLYDNDARFVFNFIRTALDYGCIAANYVESVACRRAGELWVTTARDQESGREFTIRSRVMINACGPWADAYNQMVGEKTEYHHLFSKGIHLIVDRLTDNRRVLTFFASDGRLFFLIPMGRRTCIGTTDTQVENPEVGVTEADRDFVLDNVNALLDLEKPLTRDDVIAERVGVRPLAVSGKGGKADWVQLSRKHVIEQSEHHRQLTIFGGKLTDCLNVGDEVVERVAAMGVIVPYPENRWYGEPGPDTRREFMLQAKLMNLDAMTAPISSEPLSERFWRRYGAAAFILLERIRADKREADLLIENAEYTRGEIELAARREMITRLEDFMRRRSKIELVLRRDEIEGAPGLHEACAIFFGDKAEEKLREYFDG